MATTTQAKQRNSSRPKSNGGAQASRSGTVASNVKRNYVEPLQERAAEIKDGLSEVTTSVKGELREDWDEAKEKVMDATAGAREKAREAAERVAEAADRSQEAARRVGNTVLNTIKENPIPIALAGAGIAWLAVNLLTSGSGSSAQGDEEAPESGPRRALEPIKQAAENAATQVRGKVQKLAGDAGELATRAQATLSTVTHDAGETARKLAERGKQLEQSIESTLRENPLVAGAAALALGAVIGSVLPRTRLEDQLLGDVRDDVLHKGQELAHTAVTKAEAAVKKVANVARAATEDS